MRARVLLPLLASAWATSGWALPWDKDMVDQPSVKPQEHPTPPPPVGSVPVAGRETVPAPVGEQAMFDAKEAAAAIPNPVPASPESIARGAAFFETHCQVCHGAGGLGDGLVGEKFDPAPADLNDAYTQDQAPGQLFFTLTRGRGAMPYYRDALSPEERWDVVNYVKHRFGKP